MRRSAILPLLASLLLAESAAAVPSLLSGPWCGAVTSDSIAVTAYINEPSVACRLALSAAPDLGGAVFSNPVTSVAASGNNVRLEITGLAPDTIYHYAVELDGVLQTDPSLVGSFRTLPPAGPASFRLGFASCGDWDDPYQHVYQAILTEDLRFFIHMGDFSYHDIDDDDPDRYRDSYVDALTESPQLGEMVRKLPTAYIWDDHDFSGGGSNRNSDGRTAHRQVYRETVPHYPLPAGGPDAAIYQTFTCGRVRFILTDLRSERDVDHQDDDAAKSMMGSSQKQWFKDQLVAARDTETPLIVWMSSVPFISSTSSGDNWGSYQTERTELLEFIRDQDIRNIVIISGDMHALAFDDGTATDSYVAGVHIPVFHAAALTHDGSVKGGPYSGGSSEGGRRYGVLDIADDGDAISATYHGRIATSASAITTWKSHTYQAEPALPRPASGVMALPAMNAVTVLWEDHSGVETGYRIERRMAGVDPWAAAGTTAAGGTTFTDLTTAAGVAYDYRVITVNGTTESAPSATATATGYVTYGEWKQWRLGNSDAPDGDDDDGDGFTTLEEFLFDLNPQQPDRYDWQVSPPAPDTGRVTVNFPTSTGRTYRVQFTHDLDTWLPASDEVPGDGSMKTWTDDGTVTGSAPSAEGKRYYRVVVTGST